MSNALLAPPGARSSTTATCSYKPGQLGEPEALQAPPSSMLQSASAAICAFCAAPELHDIRTGILVLHLAGRARAARWRAGGYGCIFSSPTLRLSSIIAIAVLYAQQASGLPRSIPR